mgnify:FL=1
MTLVNSDAQWVSIGGQYQVRVRTVTQTGSAYSAPLEVDVAWWGADTTVDDFVISDSPPGDYTKVSEAVGWTNLADPPAEHEIVTTAAGTPFPDRWYGTSEVNTTSTGDDGGEPL